MSDPSLAMIHVELNCELADQRDQLVRHEEAQAFVHLLGNEFGHTREKLVLGEYRRVREVGVPRRDVHVALRDLDDVVIEGLRSLALPPLQSIRTFDNSKNHH